MCEFSRYAISVCTAKQGARGYGEIYPVSVRCVGAGEHCVRACVSVVCVGCVCSYNVRTPDGRLVASGPNLFPFV